MKITVEIDEQEIFDAAMKIVAEKVAKEILGKYRGSENYCYRKAIKEIVREVIKSDIDNLSDRAVQAASVSIANKGLKKISAEELISMLQGGDKND